MKKKEGISLRQKNIMISVIIIVLVGVIGYALFNSKHNNKPKTSEFYLIESVSVADTIEGVIKLNDDHLDKSMFIDLKRICDGIFFDTHSNVIYYKQGAGVGETILPIVKADGTYLTVIDWLEAHPSYKPLGD